MFLDNRGLEIMFDDHLVREQAILDYKNMILHSRHGGFFKGHFWPKNCKFPLWSIDDCLDRKQAALFTK